MRSARAVAAACIGFLLAAAGCTSIDGVYIREGIGTSLGTADLPEVSNLQDIYVGEICRQAGLSVLVQPNGIVVCDEVVMRPAEWVTFVQAGMNDIDRRCDAYLAWLDNKRRWREPIIKQFHDTSAATAAILGLSAVSPQTIAIVATVFGFAQNSFTNFHSRLITEVDHSVVQTVVLDNQNNFRAKVASVAVNNRPAAIYLLRNYLRICMPFSIEMSINNTMTVFHRGGAEALVRSEPMLTRAPRVAQMTAAATTAAPPRRADQPIVVTPGPKQPAKGTVGRVETVVLGLDRVKALERTMCVPETGDMSSASTRSALVDLKAALYTPRKTVAISSPIIENEDQLVDIDKAIRLVPSCDAQKLAGPFEVGVIARFTAQSVRSRLRQALQKNGQTAPPELATPGNMPTGDTIRAAVTTLRTIYAAKSNIQPPIQPGSSIDEPTWMQVTKDGLVQ
jgi:hypothetical protein